MRYAHRGSLDRIGAVRAFDIQGLMDASSERERRRAIGLESPGNRDLTVSKLRLGWIGFKEHALRESGHWRDIFAAALCCVHDVDLFARLPYLQNATSFRNITAIARPAPAAAHLAAAFRPVCTLGCMRHLQRVAVPANPRRFSITCVTIVALSTVRALTSAYTFTCWILPSRSSSTSTISLFIYRICGAESNKANPRRRPTDRGRAHRRKQSRFRILWMRYSGQSCPRKSTLRHKLSESQECLKPHSPGLCFHSKASCYQRRPLLRRSRPFRPALLSGFRRASLTSSLRSWSTAPFSSVIAFSASSSLTISTKAKPRG